MSSIHKYKYSFEDWYTSNREELDRVFSGIEDFYNTNNIALTVNIQQLYDNFIDFTYAHSYIEIVRH